MPRPPRVHMPGALYYVTSRGMEGQPIFQDAKDYDTYLELLETYKQEHQCKLFAYALLPDRLHLCLEVTGEATVSALMHALNSRYTKYINKRYARSGHVFQSRFHAVVCEKDLYLLRVTRFIHAQSAERTSAAAYVQPEATLVDIGDVLAHCRGSDPRQAFAQFQAAATAEELAELERSFQHPFLGSDAFLSQVQQCREQEAVAQSAVVAAPVPALEPVLVEALAAPQPARNTRTWLSVVAMVSVLCSVLSGTYLAARAMTMAGKRVEVVVRQGEMAAPGAARALPASATLPNDLNGSTWEVRLMSMANAVTPVKDLIQFENGQVESWGLNAQGFPKSNYTLTLQPDGTLVWETMQTGPDGQTATWRGEWDGSVMRGVLSRQVTAGQVENFNFVGTYHGALQGHNEARHDI